MMIPDAAVSIGSHHAIHGFCQDFARIGGTPDNAFVLVSDGCSSSRDSEIGSKLLTIAASKFVQSEFPDEEFRRQSIRLAQSYAKALGLNESCLDATLLAIRKVKGTYWASIFGDGIIVQRTGDSIHIAQVTYESGYPNYPSYLLDPARAKQIDKEATVHLFDLVAGEVKNEQRYKAKFGEPQERPCLVSVFQEESDFIAVMTDGAASFLAPVESETSKVQTQVELPAALAELLAFKGFQPGYAKRRMQKALKTMSAKGWQHFDDLSVGVMAKRGNNE